MKLSVILAGLTAVILFTGCEVVRLSNGKYETTLSGRDDFAAVYEDLIFLRLRNPVNESGTDLGYWDWAGKYRIVDENRIELDMEREKLRNWNFYYGLRKRGNTIEVTDYRAENSYRLEFIPAVPRKNNREQNHDTPAAYPAYR